MSTLTYFDHEAALDRYLAFHTDRTRDEAKNFLDDEGFCTCCHVDYAGLDRDDVPMTEDRVDELAGEPLTALPWRRDIINHANRVDFDNDEGRTIASVRMTRTGSGYAVIIDQMSDLDNLVIKHTND